MTCYKNDKYIDYLEGLLKPREQKSFEAHLSACAHCQKILRELELTLGHIRRVSVELPPENYWPDFYQGIRRKIRQRQAAPSYKLWNWRWWWAPKPALAAALSVMAISLIIVKLVFYPAPPAPTPHEIAQIKAWGEKLTMGELEEFWSQRSPEEELQALPKAHREQVVVKLLQESEIRKNVTVPQPPAITIEEDEDLIYPSSLEEEIDHLSPEERIWLEKRLKELA